MKATLTFSLFTTMIAGLYVTWQATNSIVVGLCLLLNICVYLINLFRDHPHE